MQNGSKHSRIGISYIYIYIAKLYKKACLSYEGTARNHNLDFIKGICITLMVIFHFAYIGDTYAYAKDIVYTFHMPIFLAISGYLFRADKNTQAFWSSFGRIFRIYLLFETCYLLLSHFLPVRDRLQILNLKNLLYHLFCAPIGPFWYLHSLLILHLLSFLSFRITYLTNKTQIYLVFSFCGLYFCAYYGHLLGLSTLIFYCIGQVYQLLSSPNSASKQLTSQWVIRPSFWVIIPLVLLCSFHENLTSLSVLGLVITALAFLLFARLGQIPQLKLFCLLGHQSLYILLFSPIFTLLAKFVQNYFLAIDSSAILFLLFGTSFAIVSSLGLARAIDFWQTRSGIKFF